MYKRQQLDAATIYSILENEILPLYYARNRKGYYEGWVNTINNSIAQVSPHYTMKRQLDDYYAKFYTKEAKRFKELVANDYAKACLLYTSYRGGHRLRRFRRLLIF